MRPFLLLASILVTALTSITTAVQDPLRVFIRSGPKSHGPGAHDYPRFLKEWVPLLNERGAGLARVGCVPVVERRPGPGREVQRDRAGQASACSSDLPPTKAEDCR